MSFPDESEETKAAWHEKRPAIDLTRAFMQAHRLKPVCEGYTRQYAWFVDPDGQMRHYSELIVPVTAE